MKITIGLNKGCETKRQITKFLLKDLRDMKDEDYYGFIESITLEEETKPKPVLPDKEPLNTVWIQKDKGDD